MLQRLRAQIFRSIAVGWSLARGTPTAGCARSLTTPMTALTAARNPRAKAGDRVAPRLKFDRHTHGPRQVRRGMVGAEEDGRIDLHIASDQVRDSGVVSDDVATVVRCRKLTSRHFDEGAQAIAPFVPKYNSKYSGRVAVTVVSAVVSHSGHYTKVKIGRKLPL